MEYLPELWQGFLNTLMLSAAGFTGALIIGIVACALSIQPVRWLRRIGIAYIDLIRATPLLAQLYFLYFGLPRLGILLPEMVIGIIALSLNSGAYVAEIIRSGILSIPRGQFEAALSSGFTYLQRMRLVVLPQAVRPTISPMIGQAIVLVKDSSLLSLISVVELTRVGQQIALDRFMPVEGFAVTAAGFLLIYYLLKALAETWSRFNRMPER
ncbi:MULTISPECIES: amino acid ABC transporter permease [Brucella]|uniref:Amino ABC transporter, permease, 3-TM region, His/Glu/Gln/Arg/opine family domain protein n=1 Tax=Brucella rhizosphaerae TaxID=571254 RepID=A0A256FQN4_9HYPH|nr:amino acid ABC transporter permease [Brucella rhizosphaerae]OYR17164.1 amino ABC transporter, permease, 3-TM region, His/Glu/Gln/Arg/opine family domain protein [Brucella rhizosphaerae]